MYLYDLEVIEEEVFLRWREEVTDEYPGKGKALFQVRTSPHRVVSLRVKP